MPDSDLSPKTLWRVYLGSLMAFLLTLSAACLYISTEDAVWHREKRHAVSELAVIQASSIEHRIQQALSAASILGHNVKLQQGNLANFTSQAANLIASLGNMTNLQLAPDGIIQHIYPLAGHEKVLGQSILAHELRRKAANEAIATKQLVVDGPFELFQGGRGVIGRYPVFLEHDDNQKVFWGFSSVLIFLDDLISATDLLTLEGKGYRYQLSHLNPDSGRQEVFASSQAALQGDTAAFDIQLPNKVWTLTLSFGPVEAHGPQYVWQIGLALLTSSLVATLVCLLLKQPARLQSLVAKRTLELESNTAELKGERAFLNTLLDAIPDLIFYKDRHGAYLGCNRAMEGAIGISRDHLTGFKGVDVISNQPDCQEMQRKVFTAREEQKGETWVTLKNGSQVLFETIQTPFLNHNNEVAGLIGICRDITARKHQEDALLSTQKRLEFLLNVTSAVIYTFESQEGKGASFISDSVSALLGYPPHLFTETPEFWIEHIHPDDKAKVLFERQAVFDNIIHLVEYRFMHRDGRYRWLRDELRLVREKSNGRPLEVVGCLIDISASKTATNQ